MKDVSNLFGSLTVIDKPFELEIANIGGIGNHRRSRP